MHIYTHTHTHALFFPLSHTQVLWLQGVSDEAKLELACALIEQGMDVNSQSIERATKATSGTFVLAGIIYIYIMYVCVYLFNLEFPCLLAYLSV
jgi:hypothetical protein